MRSGSGNFGVSTTCVGELRFAANWVGSMMSRVRIYIADVDEQTGKIGAETEDPEIQAFADTTARRPDPEG